MFGHPVLTAAHLGVRVEEEGSRGMRGCAHRELIGIEEEGSRGMRGDMHGELTAIEEEGGRGMRGDMHIHRELLAIGEEGGRGVRGDVHRELIAIEERRSLIAPCVPSEKAVLQACAGNVSVTPAWTSTGDPCADQWGGVTCSEDGHVTKIMLDGKFRGERCSVKYVYVHMQRIYI